MNHSSRARHLKLKHQPKTRINKSTIFCTVSQWNTWYAADHFSQLRSCICCIVQLQEGKVHLSLCHPFACAEVSGAIGFTLLDKIWTGFLLAFSCLIMAKIDPLSSVHCHIFDSPGFSFNLGTWGSPCFGVFADIWGDKFFGKLLTVPQP